MKGKKPSKPDRLSNVESTVSLDYILYLVKEDSSREIDELFSRPKPSVAHLSSRASESKSDTQKTVSRTRSGSKESRRGTEWLDSMCSLTSPATDSPGTFCLIPS